MQTNTQNKIAIFYHNAIMGNHEEVDKQIMHRLKESGLLERADVFVKNDCKDIGLFEFPTLEMLDQFSVYHPEYYILYIMNKGVSRPDIKPIQDWRESMLYWNVDKWRECVRKLDEGSDAVGINVVDAPKRHFQGNWWWAKAEHIKRLGVVDEVSFVSVPGYNMTDRHKCEFWILNGDCRIFSPYHHKIDPYQQENPKRNYINLKDDVWNFKS